MRHVVVFVGACLIMLVSACGERDDSTIDAGGADDGATRDASDGAGEGGPVDVPVIAADRASHDFGVVHADASRTVVVRVTNTGAPSTFPLVTALTGDAAFSLGPNACAGATLAAEPRCDLTIGFASGVAGIATATLRITTAPDTHIDIPLSATVVTEAALTISPSGHDFGEQLILHTSDPVRFTVTNAGPTPTGVLAAITESGEGGEFELIGVDTCANAVLEPGASCEVDVVFFGSTRGEAAGRVEVSGTPGGFAEASLTATGYFFGYLTTGEDTHDFGAIDEGVSTSEHRFTITNPSDRPVIDITLGVTGDATDFVVSTNDCGTVVDAGESCEIGVRFAPDAPGPRRATLTMDGDTGIPVAIALTGIGLTDDVRTITLDLASVDGATGIVTSSSVPARSPELSCTSDCALAFMVGSVVTLHAAGDAGGFSGGFSGACTSSTPTCTFTVTDDAVVTSTFTPANRIFTTQGTYTLDELKSHATETNDEIVRTTSGADAICRSLGGPDYQALIARLGAQVPPGVRGFVRADGRPFATEIAPPSTIYSPPTLDEEGVEVASPALLWSGLWRSGAPGNTCFGWARTDETMDVGLAHGLDTVAYTEMPCDPATRLHLLCFETKYAAYVLPPPLPANARRVFVSTANFHPSMTGGLVAADAICASEATAAALPGTYRAMLATETASMASRFTARPDPIYRTDGVPIAPNATALFGVSSPWAPIGARANGVPSAGYVWTGSTSATLPGDVEDVCLDEVHGPWRGGTGRLGEVSALATWLDRERGDCRRASPVYCLQE